MVRISELRKALGWSQEQLADRIREQGVQITGAGISNVENGNKRGSDRLLTAWARSMGAEPMNVWHGPLRQPIEPGDPTRVA